MSWDRIPGWFDWPEIYDEAVETAPKGATLIEVGVAFGRSLSYLARKAIDSRRDDLTIYGVDPWVDDWNPDWDLQDGTRPTWGAEHAEWARKEGGPFNAFLSCMRAHAREELERVQILRGRFADRHRGIWPDDKVHMVFIDGDHRYEGCSRDILCAQRLVKKGILAGHDYTPDFPGVLRAVAELVPDAERRGNSWYTRVK